MSQEPTPSQPSPENTPTTNPKKRRRWLKVVIGVVVALLLLVLLLPTIAGLGFVRSIVVGKINQNLDGKLQIDDWSLGWTHGIALRGVTVFDPAGEKVASIEKVSTHLSLLSAIRGNYDIGKTDVEGCEFWVKLDKEGNSNVEKVAKKKTEAKPAVASSELPNVNGEINLSAKGHMQLESASAGDVTV